MKASKSALIRAVLLAGFASLCSAANVEKYLMLKDLPASCDPQNAPAPVTTFLTTDKQASLWFYLTGANAGDIAATEYYTPKGDFYQPASGAWDPLSGSGNFCFTDLPLAIAGAVPGSLPGVWTVKMKYNGAQLFSLNFTIAAPGGTGTTLTVDATDNIFAAGRAVAFSGTLPPSFTFTPSSGSALIFSTVTGSVNCTTGVDMNGPDGSTSCAGGATNINNYQGISGILHGGKSMFLAGVFLNDLTPADPAPARLDFTNADKFSTLSPLVGQVFFIGDGLAGTGTGAAQQFVVPAGATRLSLGFADAFGFHGDPGYYEDNSGSLSATFLVTNGLPASCSYSISPTSLSFIAAGGSSTIAVTSGTNCSWTAQSSATWITISSGGSGTGNGTVSYSVATNSGAARSGTLTIGGQIFTVTQAAAVSACSYSLSPTSATVVSGGSTAGVLVSTTSACSWTAVSNAAWIVVNSGSTGTGNGTINYTAAANTLAAQRSGTLSIGGQTFTVTQAGATAAGSPAISPNGVVNAASYMPSNLPGGAIARGSLFSVFGTGLGPVAPVQAKSFPLAPTLGGVGVKVTQGSTSVNALPLYAAAGQINAVMPSNAPIGDVQITVTYNGSTGAPAVLRVANSNFGAFNTGGGRGPGIFQNYVSAAQQPLNARSKPAAPGQVVTLWGTGLGPISAPDNMAPPAGDVSQSVQVLVGNKSARKLYAGRAPCCSGVDQIVFTVPADAPQGCYVPVQVKVGDNSYSNAVTMAIGAKDKACSDPANPFATAATTGGRSGSIFLIRINANLQLDSTTPPIEFALDLGLGLFQKTQPIGDLGFNLLSSLPPVGTCSVYTNNMDLIQLLSSTTIVPLDATGLIGAELDAGPALSISGPKPGSIAMPHANDEHTTGPYVAVLGGVFPLVDLAPLPPFLDGGSYHITGPGGKDVGPFSADVNLPTPVVWSNRDQITAVNRAGGVTLTWSGGDPNAELILIGGISIDETNKAGGGFFCFAPLGPGSFTVPAAILSNLPSSGADGNNVVGALLVGTVPGSGFPTFTAAGLDSGQVFYGVLNIKTVPFQ